MKENTPLQELIEQLESMHWNAAQNNDDFLYLKGIEDSIKEEQIKQIKLTKMEYQDYIDLDFKRTEMSDAVEFKKTGFYGFCLKRELAENVFISVSSGGLNEPKVYIRKINSETYHIIKLDTEIVRALILNINGKNKTPDYTNFA